MGIAIGTCSKAPEAPCRVDLPQLSSAEIKVMAKTRGETASRSVSRRYDQGLDETAE